MIKFIFILLFIPSITFAATLMEKYTYLPTPILVKEGKKLYQENGCAVCHGDKGKGDSPLASGLKIKPFNFKDYEEMKRMPTIRMEQAIVDGVQGTSMPAFSQFSDSQLGSCVNNLPYVAEVTTTSQLVIAAWRTESLGMFSTDA